jgi:hypothetical protein
MASKSSSSPDGSSTVSSSKRDSSTQSKVLDGEWPMGSRAGVPRKPKLPSRVPEHFPRSKTPFQLSRRSLQQDHGKSTRFWMPLLLPKVPGPIAVIGGVRDGQRGRRENFSAPSLSVSMVPSGPFFPSSLQVLNGPITSLCRGFALTSSSRATSKTIPTLTCSD